MSDQRDANRRFPANGKGFLFAPVLWFVWFVALYSVQGAGCAVGLDGATLRLLLVILTVLAAGAIALVGLKAFAGWERLRRRAKDDGADPPDQSLFLSYGALLHSALFFVATLWTGIPILMAEPCHP